MQNSFMQTENIMLRKNGIQNYLPQVNKLSPVFKVKKGTKV